MILYIVKKHPLLIFRNNLNSYNSKTHVIRTNFESLWGFELHEFNCIIELQNLYDQFESSVRNLQTLKVYTNSYCLGFKWNHWSSNNRNRSKRTLITHCWYLHYLVINKRTNFHLRISSLALYSNHKLFRKNSKATSCVFCGSKHSSKRCLLISETSTQKIKQKDLCFVCLIEHLANTCWEKCSCRKSHRRHNALWYFS